MEEAPLRDDGASEAMYEGSIENGQMKRKTGRKCLLMRRAQAIQESPSSNSSLDQVSALPGETSHIRNIMLDFAGRGIPPSSKS